MYLAEGDTMKKYEYIKDVSTGIEVVSMDNVSTSFPPHTHTGHYVFGIVTEGCIAIKIGDEVRRCRDGEYFLICPDVCHSIEPVRVGFSNGIRDRTICEWAGFI